MGWTAMADGGRGAIPAGIGEIGLVDGWRRWRAKLLGLGREEIERSGEERPGRSPAAALLGLARPEREDEGEEVGKSELATGTS